MTELRYVVSLGILTYASWKDVKTKSIPYILPVVGGVAALLCRLMEDTPITEILSVMGQALLPGCFLLLIAFFTGQKVGYGDGLMVIVLGAFTNFIYCVLSFMFGLCVSCLFSMLFLACRKLGMKDRIPFLPFLLIGYIFTLALQGR